MPKAIRTPLSAIASDADAKLLVLGSRFDPLFNGWAQAMAAEHRNRFEFELAIEAATGIKLADVPVRLTDDSPAEDHRFHRDYWDARRKIAPSIRYDRGNDAAITDLEDRIAELADEILAFNATTRDGLAIQVRAMVYRSHEAIEPTLDWSGEAEDPWQRAFLESLAGFVGTPFPPFHSYVEMLLERPADASHLHLIAAE